MSRRRGQARRGRWVSCFRALAALLWSAQALASGGEHGGGHGGADLHINWWGFDAHAPAVGWLLVDFVIFVSIIYFLARKPLAEFLRGRALGIRRALEEAQQAKAEAEARAAELEQRLKDLDKEVASLRNELREMGEHERQQLEKDGQKAAERMAADTEAQIASELARARAQLKAEAVRLAMELAEQKLRSSLSADDYRALNKEFVAGLHVENPQQGAPS